MSRNNIVSYDLLIELSKEFIEEKKIVRQGFIKVQEKLAEEMKRKVRPLYIKVDCINKALISLYVLWVLSVIGFIGYLYFTR